MHPTPGPAHPHPPPLSIPSTLAAYAPSARPTMGALGSATGMDASSLEAQGRRSCPGHQRPPAASSRLGCEKASGIRSKREGSREAGEPREQFPAFLLPPKHPGGKGSWGWASPFPISVSTLPCVQLLKAQLVGLTTPKEKGVGAHAPIPGLGA